LAPKLILFASLLCSAASYSQSTIDPIAGKLDPAKWSIVMEEKLDKLTNKIISQSERTLRKLQRQEAKLARRLSTPDSTAYRNLLPEAQTKYQELRDQINNKTPALAAGLTGEYLPYFDSLKGSLSFLTSNEDLLSAFESSQLKDALDELKEFQNKLRQAEATKQFVRDRKQQLNEILSHYTALPRRISKASENYNKEIYYYSQQIREYREMFRDPDKFLSKALTVLNNLPAFQQFMREHSELGSLFSLSSNYGSPLAIAGLQTREQVREVLANQIGAGSSNVGQVFSQQLQSAQSRLDQFRQKINALGGNSGDIDMPDFKPNTQYRKTFFEWLEYGTNIQTTKANFIFPSTTDLAFTVGYRIDDKKIVGIGIAGKIGWGRDVQHVSVTGQGMSLRSFFDIKIKKSFYASGGFEYNYQQPFSEIQQLQDLDMWSRSGLVGITKIISIKSKVFKKSKVQLLWDFLSYHQVPRREPVKFRVGYNF
jgi:hypothetical protein